MALFAAIPLDDAAQADVAQTVEQLSAAGVIGRFERPEKLHLTLAYVGPVQAERHGAFARALGSAAASCRPFSIRLDRLGGFPDERRPSLLWLGCSTPNDAYAQCAHAVRQAFVDLGVVYEHDAVPHLTVCRCKRKLAGMPSVELARAVALDVRELVLYNSVPAGATTRYDVVFRAPLDQTTL